MTCHDCGTDVKGQKHVEYKGKQEGGRVWRKCLACFEKEPALLRRQACEVYSRIVGYLRPLSQWNLGKQAEMDQRRLYKV